MKKVIVTLLGLVGLSIIGFFLYPKIPKFNYDVSSFLGDRNKTGEVHNINGKSSNAEIGLNQTESKLEIIHEEAIDFYETRRKIMRDEFKELEKEINFLVIGDFGYVKEPITKSLASLVYQKVKKTFIQYDFVISVGDNFYKRGISKFKDTKPQKLLSQVFKLEQLGIKWYSVVGNHDCVGDLPAAFEIPKKHPLWRQNEPYYYRDFKIGSSDKKIAFIFLNGCDLACKNRYSSECFKSTWESVNWEGIQTQIDWLKQTLSDLEQNPDVIWKVVVNHWAIFSAGFKHGDNDVLKEVLLPLLIDYKVDVVLSGHDHSLQYLRMDLKENSAHPKATQNANETVPEHSTAPKIKITDEKFNEKDCPNEIDYTYCSMDEFFFSEMTKCGLVRHSEQEKYYHTLFDQGEAASLLYEAKFSRDTSSNQYDFLHQFVIGAGGPDLEKVCPYKNLRSLGQLRYSNSIPGIGEVKVTEERLQIKMISANDDLLYNVKIFKN